MIFWCFRTVQDNIISKDKDSPLIVPINEYVTVASLIDLHGNYNEDSENYDMVTKHIFWIHSSFNKKNFFCHCVVDFVNKIEFSGQKYQTNGTVID